MVLTREKNQESGGGRAGHEFLGGGEGECQRKVGRRAWEWGVGFFFTGNTAVVSEQPCSLGSRDVDGERETETEPAWR
jgi:hypothetical protein